QQGLKLHLQPGKFWLSVSVIGKRVNSTKYEFVLGSFYKQSPTGSESIVWNMNLFISDKSVEFTTSLSRYTYAALS
ncbi:MAG TPA: hypothetical protein PLA01_07095, partial [Acetivibrio sp.]|nr:hypothetical protein [Acetivibrio sp.]